MIETATKPYRLALGEGLADVWWKTGRVTVKVAGAETDNAFSQIEVDDQRGGGTPLHVHQNKDETFYILEGELRILVGDEPIDGAAGHFLFAPATCLTPTSTARRAHTSSRPSA